MKAKETIKAKILPKGDVPLFGWLQSMQFNSKMIMEEEKGLKEIEAKMKKDQDRDHELLRGLHMDSQTSGKGKGIIGMTHENELHQLHRYFDRDIFLSPQQRFQNLEAWWVYTHGHGGNTRSVKCCQRFG